MNRIIGLLLSGGLMLMFSCSSTEEKMGVFNLLPTPQEFTIHGVSKLSYNDIESCFMATEHTLPIRGELLKNLNLVELESDAQIVCRIDNSLDVPAEGYLLQIADDLIIIKAKDEAGLLYAFMTLEQLMQDAQEQSINLPVCSIKDFPLLAYRAIHLDVKHHLEKTDYYYSLMDRLASYKVNAIILEAEDKIKYQRQPKVGSADALSIVEWKQLSDYAKARNIEISPLIQGLGHAGFVLKHEAYKALRDDPNSDWAFNPLDPRTYEVQFDLYRDAIEATPHGKYLHVGGDEVHTTGRESGKSALELQLIWLDKVSKFAEEQGRTPIFWDDMPLKHAGVYRPMFNAKLTAQEVDSIWEQNEYKLSEFLDRFPKNCIYMRWNYRAAQTIGNTKAMEWFMNHGLNVMGATAGQTRWVLMPQQESNMDNIRAFAENSINKGLNGLLLTLWDDDSPHFELYMRGIISFSEYCWSGIKRSKEELKAAFRHRHFSGMLDGKEYAFIDQLEIPVAFWKNGLLNGNKRNYLRRSENPTENLVISMPDRNNPGAWSMTHELRLEQAESNLLACDSIAVKIHDMKALAARNIYTLEVYEQVNELVRFTSKALLALKALDQAGNEQEGQLAVEEIRKLPEEFKTLRTQFEQVYAHTRILTKPDDYILDQDHHVHLANQSISFDWQFYAEMLFLKKINREY